MRSNIEDSRDNLLKDTYSIYLKSPDLKDALRIMFWCISANHQGCIKNCKPELQTSPPYLSMELDENTKEEVKSLWRYFTKYLDTVRQGPQLISMEILKYEKYLEETDCNFQIFYNRLIMLVLLEKGLEDALSVHDTQIKK